MREGKQNSGICALVALLLSSVNGALAATPFDEACARGDGARCREAGLEELARARLMRATEQFVRGCDLGDAESCDEAAAVFMSFGETPRARSFRNRAKALRDSAVDAGIADAASKTASGRGSAADGGRAEEGGSALEGSIRRCERGDAKGCDDAGALFGSIEEAFQQKAFGDRARQLRDGVPKEVPDAGADDEDGEARHRALLSEIRARKADAGVAQRLTPPPDADLPREELRPAITRVKRAARINECITEEERERMREVTKARADPTAFQPSAIWLPPLYMTDAERSYLWAGLFYFQVSDHEAETKTRALPPLVISMCTPESDTLITPLFGYRQDAEGTAGLALTYFWRRDRLAATDVLFPIFWSLRSREAEADDWTTTSGALAPIAWWGRDEKQGSHYTFVAPLYWSWGDRTSSTRIIGLYGEHRDQEGWSAGLAPLWFGGEKNGRRYDLVPPLLFYRAADAESSTVFALQTYYEAREDGFTLASVPFVFAGRDKTSHYTLIPPLLTYHWGDEATGVETTYAFNTYYQSRRDGFSLSVIPLLFLGRSADAHHTLVPPLFWQWGDATAETTIVANTFWRTSSDGYDFGVVPLYLRGRKADRRYDVVPPLLFFHAKDPEADRWFALQTYYEARADGFTLASVPFVFKGREREKHYTLIPPLLTYHSGDGETESTYVAQTFYESRRDGFTFNSVPFVFIGREGESHHTFVPPLFWRWGDASGATTIAANAFYRSKPDGFDVGLVPLYFGGRSGDSRYDLVPPLILYHSSDPEQSTWYALQTYFQARKDGFTVASVPFLFTGREGNKHYTLIPPLLTYHSGDGETETTYALNTYYERRKDGFTLASFPFVFTGREGPAHYTFVPAALTYHSGDGETETTWAVNTYYQSRKDGFTLASVPFLFTGREGPKHYTLIPPLLTYHSGDGETESTYALQTFYESRKDGFTLNSVPFLFMGREGASHHTFVPPLFWRWGDADVTTTIAANVYYRARAASFDLGVVPLYFRGRDGSSFYDFAPPLLWSWGDERAETVIAGPYFKHTNEEGFTAGVVPFWFGAERGGRRYDLIPPLLLLRASDEEGKTYWAFQTFYKRRENGFTLASIPFVFAGREDKSHYTLVPLALTYHGGDGDTETTYAVNTYYQSRPEGFTLASFPLLFMGRERAAHHTIVPPLFWRWGDEHATTTIAANVFYRKTAERYDLGVVPLYFRGREGESHYDFAPPLFWRWGDQSAKTLIAGPYFKHTNPEGMTAGVLPFWIGAERGGRRYDFVPPLLLYRGADADSTTWYALQTYYQARKGGDFTLASVPFVFAGRTGDSHHTFVPPVFFRWGDRESTTTIAANVFHRRTPQRTDFGVAPLYFHGEEGASHYTVIPPLLAYHGGDGETETTYALNTFYQSRKEGFTLASIPLLFVGRERDAHHTIVPPLFWRWGEANEGTTIAGPVFHSWKDQSFDLGVVPFYFRGRDGQRGYDVIPPLLFYRGTNGVETTTFALNTYYQSRLHGYTLASFPFVFAGQNFSDHYFHIPPLFWRWGDAQSTTTIAGNFFLSTSPTEWDAGFFPLYFGGRDEVAGSYYDVVPPLYFSWGDRRVNTTIAGTYFKREDREGFVAGLLPLWLGGRHGDDQWDLVPPLFYRHTSKEQTRVTLLPLFDYNRTRDELQILSPLFVHSKTAEHERTVALGLYWRFSGPETDARVVFPFWWDFKSQTTGTRLSTLFPLYWRYEKTDETTHLFLNVMYSKGKTPLGPSWSFHFFPFVDLASYNPDHFLWQVFGGLVGSERQGALRRNRFVWVWTEPTKS